MALAEYDDGADLRTIHAGNSSGLFVDRGDGWEQLAGVVEPGMPVTALTTVGADAGAPVLLAGVNGGIVRYSPLTNLRTEISLGSPPPLVTCIASWSGSDSQGCLLAGTLEDGVFWSVDGGFTWNPGNTGLLDMAIYALDCSAAPDGRALVLAATETNVFESRNGGRTWRSLGFPDTGDAPVQAIARPSRGECIVAGTGGAGLFAITSPGSAWVAVGQDLTDRVAISLYAVGATIIAVFETGIAVSTAVDAGWSFTSAGLEPGDRIVCSTRVAGGSLAIGLASGDVRIVPDPAAVSIS